MKLERHAAAITVAIALLVTTAIYWPGLGGGYLFDDFSNIVNNADVHVASLDFGDWRRAALASPSRELRRPLAMLSFAANEYFTGNEPFPIKATNLAIHLLNGVLLYLMLARLFLLCNRPAKPVASNESLRLTAAGVAIAWLVAPINLTAVLYAVQRMESLAQTFVLLGLWGYLCARQRQIEGRGGSIAAFLVIPGAAALGVLVKESAALLPLYALMVEVTVLRFVANRPQARRALILMYVMFLLVPVTVVVARQLPGLLSPDAYAHRGFTLAERLMTEPRILVDYIRWSLLPVPSLLGFYHDDIPLSHGLLHPPATLLAILALASLLGLALAVRKARPLFALGIFWFLAAHLLTATIIPLELVFEHRNYFSSAGLFLSISSFFVEGPSRKTPALARAALIGVLALFVTVTAIRAWDWRNPVTFAVAEAHHHPLSPRATYEMGQTLVVASGYRSDSPLVPAANAAFAAAARLPDSGALPDAGLIIVAGHMQQTVDPRWWMDLIAKLDAAPPSEEDVTALDSLFKCQYKKICAQQTPELLQAFLAALAHPDPKVRLLGTYSDFAETELDDYGLAESLLKQAISRSPDELNFQISLVRVLLEAGKTADAHAVEIPLEKANLSQDQKKDLADLRNVLSAAGAGL